MVDVLVPMGYSPSDRPEDAELIILNTCHIREKAAEKLYSELGRYEKIKKDKEKNGNKTIIAVAGCVAQAEGEEVIRRAPYVDIVFGPQTYHRLPKMVKQVLTRGGQKQKSGNILDVEFPSEPKFDSLPEIHTKGFSAFLTIQEGCDKFCSFCVVPYTRGPEYSRPVEDVLSEAKNLVACGVREITLLGQNVNAYSGAWRSGGKLEVSLADLICELDKIHDLDIIRYTTSHPADMTDDLIKAHGQLEKLAPFVHLPVQSGSDKILVKMNRRHTRENYIKIVEKLLSANSKIKLSSDFIVGFPGETDQDFMATLTLIEEVGFIQAYSFKYSPRPGTPGASLGNQVPEEIKSERLKILQDLVFATQRKFNETCVGTLIPVLLDRRGRKFGQLVGRSPYMQAVHVYAPKENLGKIVNLRIDSAHPNSLSASKIIENVGRAVA